MRGLGRRQGAGAGWGCAVWVGGEVQDGGTYLVQFLGQGADDLCPWLALIGSPRLPHAPTAGSWCSSHGTSPPAPVSEG